MDDIAQQLTARLRQNPDDLAALDQLKAHHLAAGDHAALAALLEGWAGNSQDAGAASTAFAEAAEAALSVGDRARAKVLLQHAIHRNAVNHGAAERLQTLMEEDGDWAQLSEFLDGYLQSLEAIEGLQEYKADLYFALGNIWAEQFERADVATTQYVRAIELDPNHSQAAYAARSIAEASGDIAGAAQFYEFEARAEQDVERKLQLCSKLAELRANELDDLDGAVATLRVALKAAPGDLEVMHSLGEYLLRRADGGDDPSRDLQRAAELYYQIAQAVESDQAVAYLEAALGALPSHEAALSLLESTAEQVGRDDLLPQYWIAFIEQVQSGVDADRRRMLLAQAYIVAGQVDDAIYSLEQATSSDAARMLESVRRGESPETVPPPRRAAQRRAQDPEPSRPMQAAEPSHEMPSAAAAEPSAEYPAPASAHDLEAAAPQQPVDPSGISALRAQIHEYVAARRHDDAATVAQQILQMDPADPEGFNFLEGYYRKSRDHQALRDLLLSSGEALEAGSDIKRVRLKQAATLSETKLKDVEGAIYAWQQLLASAPGEPDSTRNLKRLLRKEKRWDALAGVLESELLSITEPEPRIELLQALVALHRDKREDPGDAADALLQLRELTPDDDKLRDDLCRLLLDAEQYVEAAPLLEEQLEAATAEPDKLRILQKLAELHGDKLDDPQKAFRLSERILDIKADDLDALGRMERIDEQAGNFDRMLDTLERRAKYIARGEQPDLMMRMGRIAQGELADIERAAEYYGNALDLQPENKDALSVLTGMFEEAGRFEELVELLRERTMLEKDAGGRKELLRRTAGVLSMHLQDEVAAADCYEQLLGIEPTDEEALRAVLVQAEKAGDNAVQAKHLSTLTGVVEDKDEKRTLLFDLAELQRGALEKPTDAIGTLQKIVDELDPEFEPALTTLVELCEQVGDNAGLAAALEPGLANAHDAIEQAAVARRLADLYGGELAEDEKAMRVLKVWSVADEHDPEPLRRLSKYFEKSEDHKSLLPVLDGLATWEDDFEARENATLHAAEIAYEKLDDVDAAWERLLPLVQEGHLEAEAILHEYCKRGDRSERLANMHVAMAQEAEDNDAQAHHWMAATRILRDDLQQNERAFEASLRLLAADMGNKQALDTVDGLASTLGAWQRLSQVYDRLLKQATEPQDKIALLSRQATLLEGSDASEALDRILRCCALDPSDEALLARAEELAGRAERVDEMLMVYDRRRKGADDAVQVEYLIRGARLCDSTLSDRARASDYLKQGLSAAADDDELAGLVVRAANEFDEARPELGSDDARRSLVKAHRDLAERAEPALGAVLILRATSLLREDLEDERAAFDMLRQGLVLLPLDESIYEHLLTAAEALKRLDALDAHLSHCIDDAIEADVTLALLERRGALLEGPLERLPEAAQVYSKLLQLRPEDDSVADRLRGCLRRAGRFQDLQLAIGKQLKKTDDPDVRLKLLRENAQVWETDLGNQWEALDSWRKVLDEAPDDEEATEAFGRLNARQSMPPPDPFADDGSEDDDGGFGAPEDTRQDATADQDETDAGETDADQTDSDETDSGETDSDQTDADETDSDETDADDEPRDGEAASEADSDETEDEPGAEAEGADEPPAAEESDNTSDDEDLWDDEDDPAPEQSDPSTDDGADEADEPDIAAAGESSVDIQAAPMEVADETDVDAVPPQLADAQDDHSAGEGAAYNADDDVMEVSDDDEGVSLADLDADISQEGNPLDDLDMLADDEAELGDDIEFVEEPVSASPSLPPPPPKREVSGSSPPARSVPPPPPPPGPSRASGASVPPPPPRPTSSPPRTGASGPPPLPPRKS